MTRARIGASSRGSFLHALYGGVAGAVFAPLFEFLRTKTTLSRERVGLLSGVGYGLILSVFGIRVVFEYVLRDELDPDNALVFHVGHLVYGLTLGTWMNSREEFGDVYEERPHSEVELRIARLRG